VSVDFEDSDGTSIAGGTTAATVDDTTAPSISGFSVDDTSGQTVKVSFDSDEELNKISVTGTDDASGTTLDQGDFSEDTTDGFTYTATLSTGEDGTFGATLDTAADAGGNDGASGQSDSATVTVGQTTVTINSRTFDDGNSQSDSVTILGTFTNTADETLKSITVGFGNIAGNVGLANVEPGNVDIGNVGFGNVKIGNSGNVGVGNVEVGNTGDDLEITLSDTIDFGNVDDNTDTSITIDDVDTSGDSTTDGSLDVTYKDDEGNTITSGETDVTN